MMGLTFGDFFKNKPTVFFVICDEDAATADAMDNLRMQTAGGGGLRSSVPRCTAMGRNSSLVV